MQQLMYVDKCVTCFTTNIKQPFQNMDLQICETMFVEIYWKENGKKPI